MKLSLAIIESMDALFQMYVDIFLNNLVTTMSFKY